MRKKIKSEPIDGFTYEVTQLGAVEGRRMLVRISKIVLPTLGALIKDADFGRLSDLNIADIDIDSAAKALVEAVDADSVDKIIESMSGITEIWGPGFGAAGAPMAHHFDDHFAGRYAAMLRWLAFALKVNFSDFFDGKGSVAKLAASLRSPEVASESPST